MSRRSGSGAAGRGKAAPTAASDQDDRANKRSRDGLDQLSRHDERKPRASMIDGGDRISGSWRDGHGEGARWKGHGGAASRRKTSSAFQDRLSSSQGAGGSKASPPEISYFSNSNNRLYRRTAKSSRQPFAFSCALVLASRKYIRDSCWSKNKPHLHICVQRQGSSYVCVCSSH